MNERHLRSFVTHAGRGGNPAVVIDHAEHLDESAILRSAAGGGIETTCVYRSGSRIRARFFLPTSEMAFCGHGLLAALAVIASGDDATLQVEVAGRAIRCNVSAARYPFAEFEHDLAPARVLGDDSLLQRSLEALSLPTTAARRRYLLMAGSTRQKVLLEVTSAEWLNCIRTTERAVADLSEANGSTGIFIFCPTGDGTIAARHFPSNAGFLEDPATGTAAIALASAISLGLLEGRAYNQRRYRIRQGVQMGSPSDVYLRLTGDHKVAIGGRVSPQ